MGGLKITLKSTGQTITAKLDTDDEDCFICKDPFIFRKALIKIAQTDGKKLAEKEIYESKTFSSEVYPVISVVITNFIGDVPPAALRVAVTDLPVSLSVIVIVAIGVIF